MIPSGEVMVVARPGVRLKQFLFHSRCDPGTSGARVRKWRVVSGIAYAAFSFASAGIPCFQHQTAGAQKRASVELRRQTQTAESVLFAQAANLSFGDGRDWPKITDAALPAFEALPHAAANVVRPYVRESEVRPARLNRELRKVVRLNLAGAVNAASFSPDGGRIVTAAGDAARLWDAATGHELARFPHEAWVFAASFSPDGARIVTASGDHTARLWDAASGRELARLSHEGMVNAAAFSPDGARIVTASDGKTARLWDAASGRELARFSHEDKVYRASFSPDGARIVTASGGTARLWDAASGRELTRFSHEDAVMAASFSPDGTGIVTASGNTARLWDAASGRELARFRHEDRVAAAAFSPDGAWIVTASWDSTARLWDAASGRELARLKHEGPVTAASIGPDAGAGYLRIVTASIESAYVWQVGR